MNEIIENLYLGDQNDSTRFYFPFEPIHTIIDLSGWDAEKDLEKGRFWVVQNAIQLIATSLLDDHPTLVCCHAGIDRSPFVVACYLYEMDGMEQFEAYNYVREKRSQVIIHDDWMRSYSEFKEKCEE